MFSKTWSLQEWNQGEGGDSRIALCGLDMFWRPFWTLLPNSGLFSKTQGEENHSIFARLFPLLFFLKMNWCGLWNSFSLINYCILIYRKIYAEGVASTKAEGSLRQLINEYDRHILGWVLIAMSFASLLMRYFVEYKTCHEPFPLTKWLRSIHSVVGLWGSSALRESFHGIAGAVCCSKIEISFTGWLNFDEHSPKKTSFPKVTFEKQVGLQTSEVGLPPSATMYSILGVSVNETEIEKDGCRIPVSCRWM